MEEWNNGRVQELQKGTSAPSASAKISPENVDEKVLERRVQPIPPTFHYSVAVIYRPFFL